MTNHRTILNAFSVRSVTDKEGISYDYGGGMVRVSPKHQTEPAVHPGIVAGLASGALVSGVLIFAACKTAPIPVPLYTVSRVIDGDTFETTEKQYIRLSGIDAPETGRCGSQEAKQFLEKLVVGKPVYIKILYHLGSRLTGLAYTPAGQVNAAMLASGWAVKYDRDSPDDPALTEAAAEAREHKRGVYASRCTQVQNPDRPDCTIKGNNPDRIGTKTYHVKGCPQYDLTTVELYKGDEWFCRESEALKAGYTKARGCP